MDKTWNITIYVDQTVKGLKRQDGVYGYILEFVSKDGKPKYKIEFGEEKDITAHEMELIAITNALRDLNRRCVVTLYSRHGFLRQALLNHWMDRWKENDWMNAHGQKVKNYLSWKALAAELDKHTVALAGITYEDKYNLDEKIREYQKEEKRRNEQCLIDLENSIR